MFVLTAGSPIIIVILVFQVPEYTPIAIAPQKIAAAITKLMTMSYTNKHESRHQFNTAECIPYMHYSATFLYQLTINLLVGGRERDLIEGLKHYILWCMLQSVCRTYHNMDDSTKFPGKSKVEEPTD